MNSSRRPGIARLAAPVSTAATALSLLALTGCGSDAGLGGENGELTVVASFYPVAYLAEEIGGEHVAVTTLTEPGTEPHDLDLSPKQTAQVNEAELVVYLKGLQPAVDEAIAQSDAGAVVEAGAFTDTEATEGSEHSGTGDEHEHRAEDEHRHDDDHGHDHSHDHGAGDPHVWLDPVKYAQVAEGLSKALAKADPDHADAYQRNTAALVKRLDALDREFHDGLADADGRTFVTNHAAFGHLAERYHLHQEAIAGLNPESEPSAARMKELHRIAQEDQVSTVFFETLANDDTARTLARDTGLATDVLDPLEGITERSRGSNYFEVMRANLAALKKAFAR